MKVTTLGIDLALRSIHVQVALTTEARLDIVALHSHVAEEIGISLIFCQSYMHEAILILFRRALAPA
jgi:hypothetical protein